MGIALVGESGWEDLGDVMLAPGTAGAPGPGGVGIQAGADGVAGAVETQFAY